MAYHCTYFDLFRSTWSSFNPYKSSAIVHKNHNFKKRVQNEFKNLPLRRGFQSDRAPRQEEAYAHRIEILAFYLCLVLITPFHYYELPRARI